MRTTLVRVCIFTLLTFTGATLSACNDPLRAHPIKDAERRYETVKKSSATAAEVCAEGRRLGDAYLAANDAEGYRSSRLTTDIECMSRKMDENDNIYRDSEGNQMAPMEADNMAAEFVEP